MDVCMLCRQNVIYNKKKHYATVAVAVWKEKKKKKKEQQNDYQIKCEWDGMEEREREKGREKRKTMNQIDKSFVKGRKGEECFGLPSTVSGNRELKIKT